MFLPSSPTFNSLRVNEALISFPDLDLLRPIVFPGAADIHPEVRSFHCQSLVGTARDSHLGYQLLFLARSTLLPPFVPYHSPPCPTKVQFKTPLLTSVRLPCLLHLPPKLALMSTGPQNLPPTATLLSPPTLAHTLQIPC